MIDAELAATIARTALRNVATEYPYKRDQVLGNDVPAATQGDYVGTHWLASFALLALTEQ
jgi:hypothetical protein